MNKKPSPIFIGDTALTRSGQTIEGGYVTLLGETFYGIRNYDAMEPFFMSIVSGSDHWLFISSTGGLSAGRVSAERSLFPYYTEDKIAENSENTGNKAILLASKESSIRVFLADGGTQQVKGHVLDSINSRHIFQRDGVVHHLIVSLIP